MLRKFALHSAWENADPFHEAVSGAGYTIDDSGWHRRGEGIYEPGASGRDIPEADRLAFVSLVFDDDYQTREQVIEHIRSVTSIEFTPGECIVYLPDGQESPWYEMVWPLCTQLHEAEIKAYGPEATAEDLALTQTLRKVLAPILNQGIEQADRNMAEWGQKMGDLLGIPTLGALETKDAMQLLRLALEANPDLIPDSPEGLTE